MDCRPGLHPDQETALEMTIERLKQERINQQFGDKT
jgi:hypothetical protein